MSTENMKKEKKCWFCKKTLLDKEYVFCRRCLLEGRNKVGIIGGALVSVVVGAIGGKALVGNNTKKQK